LKHIIPLILTLSLLGCQTLPADITPPAPTASQTPVPTAAPTLTPTPTEVPLEALPMEVIVQKYLAGEIDDVSVLNFEQQKTFSIALNEKKNEQRGANPVIYTDKDGVKFYIDPITGKFNPINDGATAEQQTIKIYFPRVVDNEGYTHIYYEEEWVKIEGSNKIQFDNFESFPWPVGKAIDPKWVNNPDFLGLTIPEYSYKAGKGKHTMVPVFFSNKEVGQINIPGFGETGTLMAYVVIEDDPYSVRPTLITGQPNLYADNMSAGNPGRIVKQSEFTQKLKTISLYYLMFEVDQKNEFATSYPKSKGKEVSTDYTGLAPSNQVYDIITGKIKSNDLTLIRAISVVEPGGLTDN
jgi:hypothetical protein